MGEWKRVKLGEVCSKIGSGATPTGGKSAYKDDGVSLIRSQNVLDMSFALAGLAHIDDEQARKLDGVTVCRGDVLLNITGDSVARCCIVPDYVLPARVNQHVCIVRPRPDLATNRFVEYFLIAIKDRLLTLASVGATRNALTKETIQNLEVPLPPLPTQRRIAAVLGALDDKIELNRKICENLEAQAQALFKAWFVDFEPFGGKRPEGWKMGKLGDVAAIRRESITPDEMDEIVEHYSLPAFDESKFPTYDTSESIKSNKFKIGKNSVLLSKLNPRIKRLWDPFVDTESAVASTEFIVFESFKVSFRYFVYSVLDSEGLYQYSVAHAAGTTNSHQRVTPDDILEYEIVLPPEEDILKYCGVVEPMYASVKRRIKESRALAAMRDALLPKLMSGELAVEKVEDRK